MALFYSQIEVVPTLQVELEATTEDLGTTLRAPTSEAGLAPACKDTCFGVLRLQLWEKKYDGGKGKVHNFSCFIFFLWLVCGFLV